MTACRHRNNGSFRFAARYIRRHVRRAAAKSALTFILAALLLAAVGQFALMTQSYVKLRDDTVVKANFAGGLPLSFVTQIIRSGYVKDAYYASGAIAAMNLTDTDFIVTNNISRFTGEDIGITYAAGFDAACMDEFGEVLILGGLLAAMHSLNPGDTVNVVPSSTISQTRYKYVENYKIRHPENDLSDDEIADMLRDVIEAEIMKATQIYTVAGIIRTPLSMHGMTAFTPGVGGDAKSFGFAIELDVAEFTLVNNQLAKELRSYGERLANSGGAVDFIMDTGKLDNIVNTLSLLDTLYPIAIAAALLIGGFLCSLVIFQSSKEAAIMRMLGTTKRWTRVILALEQMILSVAGLLPGVCALLAYNGAELAAAIGDIALFAGLYLAAVTAFSAVSSAAATRKNVLELLQTKE